MFKQSIYFGAPGTGKSFQINQELSGIPEEFVFRTVIHPEYTYSDFVGQLLPYKDSSGTGFKFFPGVLTLALQKAYSDNSQSVYLVLEELSRGNVSAIFGDIFQLLDRDHSFQSEYPIRNENIIAQIPQITDGLLRFPTNLNILCSVNTNDQNVFPMDTAFKRRFEWIYVSTEPTRDLSGRVDTKLNNPKIIIKSNLGDVETNWQSFYSALNSFITVGLGLNEDKQIGQFFLKFENDATVISHDDSHSEHNLVMNQLQEVIKNKLLLYLWQDIEGTVAFSSKKLFDDKVLSFDNLYKMYEVEQVFSNNFIEDFLRPNSLLYPY